MNHLGIDPDARGGAVLLDEDGAALVVVFWRKAQKSGRNVIKVTRACWSRPAGRKFWLVEPKIALTFGQVGEIIRRYVAPHGRFGLAVEEAVVGRSAGSGLTVARRGGMIGGPVEDRASPPKMALPKAGDWRKLVLGRSPRRRKEAKKLSLAAIPPMVPRLAEAIEEMGCQGEDGVTDAAGVALWRRRVSFRAWREALRKSRSRKRSAAREKKKQIALSDTGSSSKPSKDDSGS